MRHFTVGQAKEGEEVDDGWYWVMDFCRSVECTHEAIDGSRPSVARGGADDSDALVATGEEVLKEVSEGLEAWTEASRRTTQGQQEDPAGLETGVEASRFGMKRACMGTELFAGGEGRAKEWPHARDDSRAWQ
jgi:hypothetical protein